MAYEIFRTRAAADARVAELHEQGKCAYVLVLRRNWFEVRSW